MPSATLIGGKSSLIRVSALLGLLGISLIAVTSGPFADRLSLLPIFLAVCFLLVSDRVLPDGPFAQKRFWRFVLSLSVCYLFLLIWLLFQDRSYARSLLSVIDSSLGVCLSEKSYMQCCSITWSNIGEKIDRFVAAHAIGWFVKALLFREAWFCWVFSVAFEVAEYALEHQLPNFAECWWDHWVLDVLTCNAFGIHLGIWFCNRFRLGELNWFRTDSVSRYFSSVLVLLTALQCDLNAFYLKYLLWIPQEHSLNLIRLCFLTVQCAPALIEIYRWAILHDSPRLGAHGLVLLATLWAETFVCVKFSRGEFSRDMPVFYQRLCAGIAVIAVVFPFVKKCFKK